MNAVIDTKSPAETEALGERIGAQLEPGDVAALYGGLGSGKTCLTRGIARGAGSKARVTSPTFILMHEYPLEGKPYPLIHLDLYRLNGGGDLIEFGGDEALGGFGIAVVEWAERAEELLPSGAVRIRLEIAGPEQRRARIESPVRPLRLRLDP